MTAQPRKPKKDHRVIYQGAMCPLVPAAFRVGLLHPKEAGRNIMFQQERREEALEVQRQLTRKEAISIFFLELAKAFNCIPPENDFFFTEQTVVQTRVVCICTLVASKSTKESKKRLYNVEMDET